MFFLFVLFFDSGFVIFIYDVVSRGEHIFDAGFVIIIYDADDCTELSFKVASSSSCAMPTIAWRFVLRSGFVVFIYDADVCTELFVRKVIIFVYGADSCAEFVFGCTRHHHPRCRQPQGDVRLQE